MKHSLRMRPCRLAMLALALGWNFIGAASAADNPSDEPVVQGMQPATPATGAALTPSPFEPAANVFLRLDTGHTGFLTREQVAPLERFPFDAADTNHDGRLSTEEFAKAWGLYNKAK